MLSRTFLIYLLFLFTGAPGLLCAQDIHHVSSQSRRDDPIASFDVRYSPVQQSSGQSFAVAISWLPITQIGKLGLGLETGYFAPFLQSPNERDHTVPINGQLSYHFDYFVDQILVPSVSVRSNITYLRAAATGDSVPNKRVAGIVGVHVLLDNLDRGASRVIHRTIGVVNTYLSLDYVADESKLIRFGLRLEL